MHGYSHLQLSGNVGLMSNQSFELASISKFTALAVHKKVRYESCTVVLGISKANGSWVAAV